MDLSKTLETNSRLKKFAGKSAAICLITFDYIQFLLALLAFPYGFSRYGFSGVPIYFA